MSTKTKNIIFTIVAGFTIVFLLLGYFLKNSTTRDLFINLASSCITTLLAIFIIDSLIKHSEEEKWTEAKKTAKMDMVYLSNLLTSHMLEPLGYNAANYKLDRTNIEESSRMLIKNFVNDILKKDIRHLLKKISIEKWKQFYINFSIIRQSLSESVQLYNMVLPPEVLGKLLAVRKAFQDLYSSAGLIPELFTNNEETWPDNKGGIEHNRSIRATLLKIFSGKLQIYFKELKEFINTIDNWK